MADWIERRLACPAFASEIEIAAFMAMLPPAVDFRARRKLVVTRRDYPIELFVSDGFILNCATGKEGARQVTSILLPGDRITLHDESGARSERFLFPITESSVHLVSHDELSAFCSPNIALTLAWLKEREIRSLRSHIVNIGVHSAFDKIGHFLCEVWLRSQAVGLCESGALVFPATQEDIGDAAGITPVHTNRMLRRYADQGILTMSGRVLRVPNVERLMQQIWFDAPYLVEGHLAGSSSLARPRSPLSITDAQSVRRTVTEVDA
jgi:CRP-like cAMP-binding protein